jgi:hypothetical protein
METIDIAAIRAAIKSNLSTLTTLHRYDFEPKDPKFPCAVVSWPDQLDPRATLGGGVDLVIPVRFQVMWNGDESTDQALMDLMEAAVNAIESDPDLNNTVDDVSCGPFSNIGVGQTEDGRTFMQFVVPVEVMV